MDVIQMSAYNYDVAIIGGGPAGSTCGNLLKKYAPQLRVLILERERFPRDHIGESQLPIVSRILQEMDVWDEVERANFPIKVGATYRWGKDDKLWDFHFLQNGLLKEEPRPARYEGDRQYTAFQVDRSTYDEILLNSAAERGCEVRQATPATALRRDGDLVTWLELGSGERITAKYYVDASGGSGFLRRNMGIGTTEPSSLKNVAFWDYWQNAEWAVEIGVGGTRVQIMSLSFGWIWFIPLGPERTSVGFVCPADYYKRSGLRAEELYIKAVQAEPRIAALLKNATRESKFGATKDWSFVADRLAGQNWLLAGESGGFADPILAAGLSLTHIGAKEAACTLIALLKPVGLDQGLDPQWLKEEYEFQNKRRIAQHIRFADYWYGANAHFSELKEFTREIARDAGLEYDADQAWQWLGTGGFLESEEGIAGLGGCSIGSLDKIIVRLSAGGKAGTEMPQSGASGFRLNLQDASKRLAASYEKGRITPIETYARGDKRLRLVGLAKWLAVGFSRSPKVVDTFDFLAKECPTSHSPLFWRAVNNTLDAMIRDGWLIRSDVAGTRTFNFQYDSESPYFQDNSDYDDKVAP